jgi:hypothetical protein
MQNHDVLAEMESTYAFTLELMRRWVTDSQKSTWSTDKLISEQKD